MKLALVLIVACMVAYSAAKSIRSTTPTCRPNDVGKKFPHLLNPQRYYECTSSGLKLKKCPPGDWFNNDCQDCVKAGNNRPDRCPGDGDSGEDSNSSSGSSEDPEPEPEVPAPEEPEPEEPAPENPESSESNEAPEPEHPESSESKEDPETEHPESSESKEDPEPEPEDPEPEHPESSESKEDPEPEHPESSESKEDPEPEHPESSESKEDPEPEPEEPSRPCTVKCTQPWDVPEYHPDPYSCNSFYECSNGVPHHMPCPEGLVFNPRANPGPVCDWPWNYPDCKPSCTVF